MFMKLLKIYLMENLKVEQLLTVYGLDQDAVGIAPTTKKLSPTRYIRLCNQEIEKLKKVT